MARVRSALVMIFLDFKDFVAEVIDLSMKISAAPGGIWRALAWILSSRFKVVALKGLVDSVIERFLK